jgi:dTDP-glucose 4,6-dehydratase
MWTVLLAAEPGSTYNVGSEEAVSIAELAERTARILRAPGVRILGRDDPGWNPGRYALHASHSRGSGPLQTVDLDMAIRRTALANGWTR